MERAKLIPRPSSGIHLAPMPSPSPGDLTDASFQEAGSHRPLWTGRGIRRRERQTCENCGEIIDDDDDDGCCKARRMERASSATSAPHMGCAEGRGVLTLLSQEARSQGQVALLGPYESRSVAPVSFLQKFWCFAARCSFDYSRMMIRSLMRR